MAIKLLVTLDGSHFAEGILDAAVRLAEQTGAEVTLLEVVPPAHGVADVPAALDPGGESQAAVITHREPLRGRVREIETATQAAERQESEALDYLHGLAHRFPGGAQPLVRAGKDAADEIVRAADDLKADLIVMATHGRTGLLHLIVGGTAAAVLRTGRRPVVLLRPDPKP